MGRPITLDLALRQMLDEICPESGLLFPRYNFRPALRKAAFEVLGDTDLARHVSPRDFRHAVSQNARERHTTRIHDTARDTASGSSSG
jgi:hypothetical protein